MRTFKEFINIAEKYYEPDQPLPSGKTPYGKATSSYYRQKGEYFRGGRQNPQQFDRVLKQVQRRNNQVSRGADNPDFDWKPDKSGRYDIRTDGPYSMQVSDVNNDVVMKVQQKGRIAAGNKPLYDVSWYNMKQRKANQFNPGEARGVVKNVVDMWKNQVAPRIPSNSVLTNFPLRNDTSDRNTRAKMYSKVAGFGDRGPTGDQYANVGRNPSPKQSAKGAQRITPMPGDTRTSPATTRQIDDLNIGREHKWGPKADEPKYFQGPRKIAPAKPSRPSVTASIKALKNTPPVKAPNIPKPKATNKVRFRASGSLSNAGAASNMTSYTPGSGGRFGIGGVGLAD